MAISFPSGKYTTVSNEKRELSKFRIFEYFLWWLQIITIFKILNICSEKFIFFYRPRRVASEGYVFTGICLFNLDGGDMKCIMG